MKHDARDALDIDPLEQQQDDEDNGFSAERLTGED
jgi:hypothetical protein